MKRSNHGVKVVAGTLMFVASLMIVGVFGIVQPVQAQKQKSCKGLLNATNNNTKGPKGHQTTYDLAHDRGCH